MSEGKKLSLEYAVVEERSGNQGRSVEEEVVVAVHGLYAAAQSWVDLAQEVGWKVEGVRLR